VRGKNFIGGEKIAVFRDGNDIILINDDSYKTSIYIGLENSLDG